MRKLGAAVAILCLCLLGSGCASSGIKTGDGGQAGLRDESGGDNPGQAGGLRASEFILGVGDVLDVAVYRNDDLKRTLRIGPSGRIMYPLIGDVQAAGRSIFTLRDEMRDRLAKYLVDPQITITVSAIQSRKIMVLGEVKTPGVFPLDTDVTVLEAIMKAGGITDDAKKSSIYLIKRRQGRQEIASFNLRKLLNEGDVSQDQYLQNGDIVYVPIVDIANVSWFFSHLGRIISPVVSTETGVVLWPDTKKVLTGESLSAPLAIPAQ